MVYIIAECVGTGVDNTREFKVTAHYRGKKVNKIVFKGKRDDGIFPEFHYLITLKEPVIVVDNCMSGTFVKARKV